MKRWNRKLGSMAENPRVDSFLADIEAVYRKHGLSLGHEDGHGSFIVEPLDQFNVEWLHEASDDTGKEPMEVPPNSLRVPSPGFCTVMMPDGFKAAATADTNEAAAKAVLMKLKARYGREFRLTWEERGISIDTREQQS